jgi:hypothetical protein
MGRSLKTRYKEHLRSIKNNKDDSAFAQHILNMGHQYGPMEQFMEMIEGTRKGRTMNIKENFYIYQFNHVSKFIQEQKHTKEGDHQNSLFDIAVELNLSHHPPGHVARMGEKRNAYRTLVGKPEGKRPLGRPRRRWVDNIKIDFREIGWDGVDLIDLAQDRDQWRALVNTVMNLRVP